MTYNLHQDVYIQSTKNDISPVIDVLSSEESGWIQTIGSIYGREAPTGLEWTGFFSRVRVFTAVFFSVWIQEWDAFSNETLRWICRRLGSVCGMVGVCGSGIMHGWYLKLDRITDSWVGYERQTRQNKIRAWTNPHKRSGTKSYI